MFIRMFTDGACSSNPGPGGYAAIITLETTNKIISGYEENTTNNRMELKGVIEGISKVLDMVYQDKKIDKLEIISDSAYVVNAINQKWIYKWMLNKFKSTKGDDIKNVDLWKKLFNQLEEAKFINLGIVFTKVKGHNGEYFNELADEVARGEIKKHKKE